MTQKSNKNNINHGEFEIYKLPSPALNMYLGWILFVVIYGFWLIFCKLLYVKALAIFNGQIYIKFDFYIYFVNISKVWFFVILAPIIHAASFSTGRYEALANDPKLMKKISEISNYYAFIVAFLVMIIMPLLISLLTYSFDYTIWDTKHNIEQFKNLMITLPVIPNNSDFIVYTISIAFLYLFFLIAEYQFLPAALVIYVQKRFWKINVDQ